MIGPECLAMTACWLPRAIRPAIGRARDPPPAARPDNYTAVILRGWRWQPREHAHTEAAAPRMRRTARRNGGREPAHNRKSASLLAGRAAQREQRTAPEVRRCRAGNFEYRHITHAVTKAVPGRAAGNGLLPKRTNRRHSPYAVEAAGSRLCHGDVPVPPRRVPAVPTPARLVPSPAVWFRRRRGPSPGFPSLL